MPKSVSSKKRVRKSGLLLSKCICDVEDESLGLFPSEGGVGDEAHVHSDFVFLLWEWVEMSLITVKIIPAPRQTAGM